MSDTIPSGHLGLPSLSQLQKGDLQRFAMINSPTKFQISVEMMRDSLDRTFASISEYLHGTTNHNIGDNAVVRDIQTRKNEIKQTRDNIADSSKNINDLIERTTVIHSTLQAELAVALSSIPPVGNATRSASADFLAATIETSLVKLSLIRARAHRALYHGDIDNDRDRDRDGSESEGKDLGSMQQAIATAYSTAKREDQKMVEEERVLDQEIAEYEGLLRLVDGVDGGGGGGYKQVVEDWTRVRQDMEECRQDLRRLGWTGN